METRQLHSGDLLRFASVTFIFVMGIFAILASNGNDKFATIIRSVGSGAGGSEIQYIGVGDCTTAAIGPTGTSGIGSMAKDSSGTLYAVNYQGTLVQVNSRTGQATTEVALTGLDVPSVRALTFDSNDNLYAVTGDPADPDKPHNLYRIDIATGNSTHIGDMTYLGIQAMATAPDGTVYVWDMGGHPFWSLGLGTVDTQTGDVTDVNPSDNYGALSGNTPKPDIQTLVFMSKLYGIGNGNVYEIDTSTGQATMTCFGVTTGGGIGAEYVYVAWPD